MKALLVGLLSTTMILAAPLASAGRGHGHYGHGGGHGYYGGHGYGHGYYGHRHRKNNDEVAYLIGGLLLGGLVTHAYHRSQERVYSAPVQRSYYSAPSAGQRLVRDSRGGCYTSEFDGSGTEYRTPVDPALCNW